MLPPLRDVRAGLGRATEALVAELAQPGGTTPDWDDLQWRLATSVAAAHGMSPLLAGSCAWAHRPWQRFLRSQRRHVALRYRRIAELLQRLDAGARSASLALLPLKGSALHAMGVYAPGERPMADIDLLVRGADAEAAAALLRALGYREVFAQWKHRVFKPVEGEPVACLGEHRDTPVTIELHTSIRERLPVTCVDITDVVYPRRPRPGLNDYPCSGALLGHLLLHAAGNVCSRSMRAIHLHDIALLAARLGDPVWDELWPERGGAPPWWALPPLRLVERYYPGSVPGAVLARLEAVCPMALKAVSRRHNLSAVSCSELWVHAFAGMEWSRSFADVAGFVRKRIWPSAQAAKERADQVRTQLWLQDQCWATASHQRRVLTWLIRPIPRMDTLYVVTQALQSPRPAS